MARKFLNGFVSGYDNVLLVGNLTSQKSFKVFAPTFFFNFFFSKTKMNGIDFNNLGHGHETCTNDVHNI